MVRRLRLRVAGDQEQDSRACSSGLWVELWEFRVLFFKCNALFLASKGPPRYGTCTKGV